MNDTRCNLRLLVWTVVVHVGAGLTSISADPGDLIWERQIGETGRGSSFVSADESENLYVTAGQMPVLYSLSKTGSTNWTFDLEGRPVSVPVVWNDRVYLPSGSGILRALNTEGQSLWSYTNAHANLVERPPAIGADGTIYLSTAHRNSQSTDQLVALDPEGKIIWTVPHRELRPMISPEGLIAGGNDSGQILGILLDGSTAWSTNIFARGGEGAMDAAGNIYVAMDDEGLFSYDASGQQRWLFELPPAGNPPEGIALDESGRLFLQDGAGRLVCLNPNGTLAWEYAMPDSANYGPAVGSDGTVYVCSMGGELHAVSGSGGFLWKYETGENCFQSPLLLSDGQIVFSTRDGKIYMIEGSGAGPVDSDWPMVGGGPGRFASLQTNLSIPSSPSGLTASFDSLVDQVEVLWESAEGAQTYSVYRSASSDPATAELRVSGIAGALKYSDRGAVPGETFYYWVQSFNSQGSSELSGPIAGMRSIPETGDLLHQLPYAVTFPPAIDEDGSVYLVSSDGIARGLTTWGQIRWEITFFEGNDGAFAGHPVVGQDGNVLITVNFRNSVTTDLSDGVLISLSPGGEEQWRKELNQIVFPPAVAMDGSIHIAVQEDWLNPVEGTGGIYTYNPGGELQWFYPVQNGVFQPPVIQSDGTLLFGGQDGYFHAVKPDGQSRWTYFTNNQFSTPIRPGPEGSLYLYVDGSLQKLTQSGNVEWTAPDSDVILGSGVVDSNGNLLVTGNGLPRRFQSYDPSGEINWQLSFGSEYIALSEGDQLLMADGNRLRRFDSDGMESSSYSIQLNVTKRFTLAFNGVAWLPMETGLIGLQTASGPAAAMWPLFAGNPQNQSRFTSTLPVPSNAPQLTASTDTFATHVLLEWNDVSGAQEYDIWRSETSIRSEGTILATGFSGSLQYEDRSAAPETLYYYWIRATNSAGEGPWSDAVMGSSRLPVPGEVLDVYPYLLDYDEYFVSAPALATSGRIYTGASKTNSIPGWPTVHLVAGLNENGGVDWEHPLEFPITSIPVVLQGGGVAVVGDSAQFFDLNGTLMTEGGPRGYTPALDDNGDLIYLGHDQVLTRLNPNGEIVWRSSAGGSPSQGSSYVKVPSILPDGSVALLNGDGNLVVVDSDGTRRWMSERIQFGVRSTAVPGPNHLIYAGGKDRMYAFHWDGQLAWETSLPLVGDCHSPAFDEEGNLYFMTLKGHCISLTGEGVLRWATETGSRCFSETMVTADGRVLFGSEDGNLYSMDKANGELLWSTSIGFPIRTSPVLSESGTGYVRANDGNVYAIWVDSYQEPEAWSGFRRDGARSARQTGPVPVPDKPVVMDVTQGTHHQRIALRWQSVRGASYYEVWRGLDNEFANASLISDRVTGTNQFVDADVTVGNQYRYWLVAKNAEHQSVPSSQVVGWIRPPVPGDLLNEVRVPDGGFLRYFLDPSEEHLLLANRFELMSFDRSLELEWSVPIDSLNYSSAKPLLDGRIMVPSDNSGQTRLQWFDANGTEILSQDVPFRLGVGPAIRTNSGSVWAAVSNAVSTEVSYAVSLSPSGTVEWSYPINDQLAGHPVLAADGSAYFLGWNKNVYGFTSEGDLVLSNRLEVPDFSSLGNSSIGLDGSIRFTFVYFQTGQSQHRMVAFDPFKRAFVENVELPNSVYVAPLQIDGGKKLLGDIHGSVRLLAADNSEIWTNRLAGIVFPLRTENGDLIVGSARGLDYLSGEDGAVQWSFSPELQANFNQPIVADDGTIYVADSRGDVRAIYNWQPAAKLGWNYPGGDALGHRRSRTLLSLELVQTNSPLVAAEPYELQSHILHENEVAQIHWTLNANPVFSTNQTSIVFENIRPSPGNHTWVLTMETENGSTISSRPFEWTAAGPRLQAEKENEEVVVSFEAHAGWIYQLLVNPQIFGWQEWNPPLNGQDDRLDLRLPIHVETNTAIFQLQVSPENISDTE